MNLSKKKLTNKKFYNKWLYKVSLDLKGGGIFSDRSVDQIKDVCYGDDPGDRPYSLFYKAYHNKEEILSVCEFLEKFNSDIWSKRVENTSIDFYTNNVNFYNQLSTTFEKLVIHQFEPSDEMIEVLNERDFVIAGKKLPHNRYNYRVYLMPHKIEHDTDEKIKYLNWLESQNPKIRCSAKVRQWFLKTRWNWDRRYVLVEDDSTLLMLKLRNSEVVGRIYKYVISDK